MTALLAAVFLAALAGGVHCVAMCGPLVAFYAGSDASLGRSRALGHIAYNVGRLLTYTALGAVAGSLGAALDFLGGAAGFQRIAAFAAGAVMILWGLAALLTALNVKIPRPAFLGATGNLAMRLMSGLREKPPIARALLIGLFSTFLPCGWLWAFAVIASGTGGALAGALVMAAFWLGSLPWLAGFGVGVQTLAGPLRRRAPVVLAVLMMIVGFASILLRVNVPLEKARRMATMRAKSFTSAPIQAEGEGKEACH